MLLAVTYPTRFTREALDGDSRRCLVIYEDDGVSTLQLFFRPEVFPVAVVIHSR